MTDKFTDNLAKMETLLEQVRDATREGRELLKDMRHERKEVEDFKKQMQKEMRAWLESSVDEHIVPVLQASFETLKPQIDSLYKRVESQVELLARPLEVMQPLIKQNEAQTAAICATLDAIESSGSLQMLQTIAEMERERRANLPSKEPQALREEFIKSMIKDGAEIHHFTSDGDHLEYTWDEVEGKAKPKDT